LLVCVTALPFIDSAQADYSADDLNPGGGVLVGQQLGRHRPLAVNEFMASNSNSMQDPQGQYDDWIEIHNYGSDAIDLGGMYLTDDLSVAVKWQVPDNDPAVTTILAGGYLLIWTDNDTTDAGLHASFRLSAGGEEIGLFDSDGVTLIDSIVFGKQTADVSYGRYPDADEGLRFFGFPSPEAENSGGYLGEVAEVKFSRDEGFYDPVPKRDRVYGAGYYQWEHVSASRRVEDGLEVLQCSDATLCLSRSGRQAVQLQSAHCHH